MKPILTALICFICVHSIHAQIGVGTTTPNSTLDIRGSLSLNIRVVTSATTLTISDHTILFTGTVATTITLPTAASISGRVYQIKNASTTLPTPVLTIATTSSQTIDGLTTWLLDDVNENVILMSNGSNWNITGQSLPGGSGIYWTEGGNSVASMKSFGTINNFSIPFIANNVERMRLSNTGNLGIGTSGFDLTNPERLLVDAGTSATSYNVISGKGTINNYLQLNIQNRSNGASASSDVVATSDNGNESVNFVDLGINSSAYSASTFTITGVNDAYLYSTGNDFAIGNSTSSKVLKFFTGGTLAANERMRIDGSGNVGIGITNPSNKLAVNGTNPLLLGGLQNGSITDSILTVSNGVVKRVSASGFGIWYTTGNAGTNATNNFLGTTDAIPLSLRVNNVNVQHFELNSVAIGIGATTNNSPQSYAFGSGATVGFNKLAAMAIGNNSAVNNDSAFSIGTTAIANANNSFAIGTGATASSTNSFAIGRNATIGYSQTDAVAIGVNATANQSQSIAIGSNSTAASKAIANGTASISIGNTAVTNSANSIALGTGSTVGFSLASPATALGSGTLVNGNNGVALGNTASIAFVANSTALGAASSVTAPNSTAVGYHTQVTKSDAVILGDLSNTSLAVGIGSEAFSSTAREKLLVDAGTSATSYNVISGKGTIDSYLQLNIQNRSATAAASSDIVATADNGNESINFVNLGINSSAYSSSGILGGPNNAYLYTTGNDFIIGTNANNKNLIFFTTSGVTGAERFRITNAGVQPGADNSYTNGTSSSRWSAVYAVNGTIQTSDARLKTNIQPLHMGLNEVMKMMPVSYDWKDKSGKNKIGLIAQEVRKIVPQVVVGDESKENLGMNYAELVPVLINAIKEQQQQFSDQQKEIELLKQEVELLKKSAGK